MNTSHAKQCLPFWPRVACVCVCKRTIGHTMQIEGLVPFTLTAVDLEGAKHPQNKFQLILCIMLAIGAKWEFRGGVLGDRYTLLRAGCKFCPINLEKWIFCYFPLIRTSVRTARCRGGAHTNATDVSVSIVMIKSCLPHFPLIKKNYPDRQGISASRINHHRSCQLTQIFWENR